VAAMNYLIEIDTKKGGRDPHGAHIQHDIKEMGVTAVSEVRFYPLYAVEGDISKADIEAIAAKLLIDPITETYRINPSTAPGASSHIVEVWLKHGVTDTVAGSVLKAVQDLGIKKMLSVKTGQKFVLKGKLSKGAAQQLAERLLVNPMIQTYSIK